MNYYVIRNWKTREVCGISDDQHWIPGVYVERITKVEFDTYKAFGIPDVWDHVKGDI